MVSGHNTLSDSGQGHCFLAGLLAWQGHLYLQILWLFDRLKQLGLLQRREPACCPLPVALRCAARVWLGGTSHVSVLAETGWDIGQERSTGGVSFEFSSGKQRPLISEVFETFPHFHIFILKVEAFSGFGYLQALLTQGCQGCALQHHLLPPVLPLQQKESLCVERCWDYMTYV